jgi:DNA topoisomerase III
VELVQIIHEELLKSAELTGIWEKKLREIEKKTYDARQFLEELKQMVSEIVMSVLSDNTNRRITIQEAVAQTEEKAKKEPKKRERKASAPKEKKAKAESKVPASSPSPASIPSAPASAPATGNADTFVGQPCPVCGKGTIIKGKTAYGCSEWRNGCTYRKNFE